jgi:hypothetical protein
MAEIKSNFLLWFLEMLKQQGLSFVLLGVAVFFLWTELKDIEEKNEQCNQEIIEIYRTIHLDTIQELKKSNKIQTRLIELLEQKS